MLNSVWVLWVDEIGVELADVSEVELEQDSPKKADPEAVLIGCDGRAAAIVRAIVLSVAPDGKLNPSEDHAAKLSGSIDKHSKD